MRAHHIQMVICGLQGPIVTTVRSILTPHPLKELRVKNTYITHKEIKAAQVRPHAMPRRRCVLCLACASWTFSRPDHCSDTDNCSDTVHIHRG